MLELEELTDTTSSRIQLTVVGLDGKRHLIRGLEGQSLANVLHANYEVLGEEGTFLRSFKLPTWQC